MDELKNVLEYIKFFRSKNDNKYNYIKMKIVEELNMQVRNSFRDNIMLNKKLKDNNLKNKITKKKALLWTGNNHREMFDFLTGTKNKEMTRSGTNFRISHLEVKGGLIIKTLEGEHQASIGDYIIKGLKGEFYPCKPEIFWDSYEEY